MLTVDNLSVMMSDDENCDDGIGHEAVNVDGCGGDEDENNSGSNKTEDDDKIIMDG